MERLIDADALIKAINKFPYGYRGRMSHTELHFMIENYVFFISVGLLILIGLILAVLALLEKWRGEKKNEK